MRAAGATGAVRPPSRGAALLAVISAQPIGRRADPYSLVKKPWGPEFRRAHE